MRQRIVRHQRRHMPQLRLLRPQKLSPRRRIKKQIPHCDRCPLRQPRIFHAQQIPAGNLHHGAHFILRRPRLQTHPRHAGNRGQRLPTKPQRSNRLNKSSDDRSFDVACRSNASSASSRPIPCPLSTMRISFRPPASISTRIRVAPASSEFSSNSFTTEAGRSTTSPAAIWLATWSDKTRIFPITTRYEMRPSRCEKARKAIAYRAALSSACQTQRPQSRIQHPADLVAQTLANQHERPLPHLCSPQSKELTAPPRIPNLLPWTGTESTAVWCPCHALRQCC